MSTPEYINSDYSYDAGIRVPLFDEDGDLAVTTVPFDVRASQDMWHEPGASYPFPNQECVNHEQIDICSMAILAQLFQDMYMVGWGELGGASQSGDSGSWEEPASMFA